MHRRNPLKDVDHEKQSKVGKHGADLAGETHVSREVLGILARHIDLNAHVQDSHKEPLRDVVNEEYEREDVG